LCKRGEGVRGEAEDGCGAGSAVAALSLGQPLMDPSFLFSQFLGGLTAAMFLFLIASGLSLIFGVLRVLNFAHGSFYMLGAYIAWQGVHWGGATNGIFGWGASAAPAGVALLGGLIERFLFRYLYGREELYQLLFTYAL